MKRLLSLLRTWLLAVSVFLFLGYMPVSAQYYMNVFTKNGETVQFEVAELDNVSFTSTEVPSYEYVDLGLSVNWATFNVGATKPEEYGDYFAWGETEPYYEAGYAQEDPQAHWKDGKSDGYNWFNYKWFNGTYDSLTKYYNTRSDSGTVDNKTVLDPEDDVAHVLWGDSWRMPTAEEQEELRNNCTWTWYDSGNTEFNGVAGYKVTSNKDGYTDRSIFLPAAGYRYDTGLYFGGSNGGYGSSSLSTDDPICAYILYFDSGRRITNVNGVRFYGFSVRPVLP